MLKLSLVRVFAISVFVLNVIPAFATTVSPTSATVQENATKQFTASTASTWTTTCGSISSAGLFKAPLYPSTTCKVTATATNGSGAATAALTIVSPITMTPVSAKTPQGKTQQFTASAPVTWSAKCGTITSGGLFTATGTVGSNCTIEGIATGTVKYTVYGVDTITAPTTTTFTVSPLNPTVAENNTLQFTSSSAATWTTNCGTISSAGLFKAPLYPSTSCTVTATATNGSGSASTKPTIVSPITMTPVSAKTPQGQTQQFTASSPVSWIAKCGTITSGGLFTASAAVGSNCTIEGIATGTIKYTVYGVDTITTATTFTLSPLNPTLNEGGSQQFTASSASTWTASCGTIGSSTGLFTAPLVPSSCTITATATDGSGHKASTSATVKSPIVITPSSATTAQGQTQQFTANSAVTWSASCGSINSTGLYTASASAGSACKITATAATGTAYTASVVDTIGAAATLTIAPSAPTLAEGATQQFTSSVASTWTASCGSIDVNTGAYTAPLSPGSCTITATATDGSGHVSSTSVTVTSPLVITPASATTNQGQTQQFTASAAVTWQSSCGSIDTNGLFVASASQGAVCTITATAASGTAYTATAKDTIGAPPAFTLSPLSPTVSENATQQFTTSLSANFSASCGSIDSSSGLYTAPLSEGQCTVTATSTSDSTKTASTTVTVTSPLTVTPSVTTTAAQLTQQFTANLPATWQASCGSIDANGLFTAPASQGSVCTITATASSGPAYTGTAKDTIGAPPALTISPTTPTLQEGAGQNFTSDIPATFSADCGSIDTNSGAYTAPLSAGSCTITATASDGSGNTASTIANITSPLVITPATASLVQNATQQFTANMAATWTSSCGSVDSSGLFTAPASSGTTTCQVTATASSGTAYTTTALVTVSQFATLTMSPLNSSLSQGGTEQFTTSIPATFTASCGTIDSNSGDYTAPLTSGSCTVTATATDSSGQVVSTKVTVTSPLVIQPSTANTGQGLTQQFTANMAATWTASCGSIDATGLFTATSAPGTLCTITATASSGTAYTGTATDSSTSPPAISIVPVLLTLGENGTQQFNANEAATFSASCGNITGTGLYTAPLAPGSCTVMATPVYGGGSAASASVTVTSPLTISPATATTGSGLTQQFTANMAVTWSTSCGSINSSGLFTASGTQGTVCTIKATATGSVAYTNTAKDTVGSSGPLTISPTQIALSENGTQQFTATAPASWKASCGSISSGGLYTAPLTTGTCTVTATATDGSGQTASTTATISSPMTITPGSTKMHALNKQTFTASQAVTWATSCGSIASTGVFTAPASATTCTVTATASSGTAYTTKATATIDIVNQVRWRNNAGGTGLQSNELALTPANVNSTTFGQIWSASVDGGVWAEPLYMNALTVNGAAHNVVFVATDNDSVYALDGDTGAQLWKKSLLPSGATAVAGTMVDDQYIASIGVLGTPAIDSGTLYVVSETAEQSATVFNHRLHALDLATGAEKFGGPVLISDTNLQPKHKLQRPGLTVVNGTVYVAFGSLGDKSPYHGLIFAFDENTLAHKATWNSTPTGTEGGIWQAGGAPTVDSSGNVYVLTGNGYSDAVTNFGESAIKLSSSLQMLDFFTPHNAASLTASDLDLGSASVPVMPDQNGNFPHELIFCGKSPVIYVVNRDNMGKFNSSSDNIVQEISNAVGGTATGRDSGQACFTSPSAWGTNIYFVANGDVLKQFTLDASTGKLSTTPTHQGTFAYGWPGSQSMVSANGSSNGIIWTFDNSGKKLRADNASNVSTSLYVSAAINSGNVKWATPTVINGHVYLGGQGIVVGFGLH